jgi:hypothetical protein
MKIKKPAIKPIVRHGNVSIHRAVLDATQDFLSAVIIEFIHYRVTKNDNREVWLKIDWILEALPYISRTGLAKKLDKLVKDDLIIKKEGEGRHYHRCWYKPSAAMTEACNGRSLEDASKVYYNQEIAKQDLEASVIYAAIANLLKANEDPMLKIKGYKKKVGFEYGRTDDKLLLDYTKLAEGSGLSISKVRKAVRWLIKNKKIKVQEVFGNKRMVSLASDTLVQPADIESYFSQELPTESYPHAEPESDDPTECYPHKGD